MRQIKVYFMLLTIWADHNVNLCGLKAEEMFNLSAVRHKDADIQMKESAETLKSQTQKSKVNAGVSNPDKRKICFSLEILDCPNVNH